MSNHHQCCWHSASLGTLWRPSLGWIFLWEAGHLSTDFYVRQSMTATGRCTFYPVFMKEEEARRADTGLETLEWSPADLELGAVYILTSGGTEDVDKAHKSQQHPHVPVQGLCPYFSCSRFVNNSENQKAGFSRLGEGWSWERK